MTSLFVGVVSHERSRFAVSQGPDGLAAQLTTGMGEAGLPVELRINTVNLHDPSEYPVDQATVLASQKAQSKLEEDWDAYLQVSRGVTSRIRSTAARHLSGVRNKIRPADISVITRLINIELSHLDLFEAGLASGAPWVLVLEDDAMSDNVADCVSGITGLLATDAPPGFINLSHSFSLQQLGIDHLLEPADVRWMGSVDRRILTAQRPVTNTVCAVLYRSDFLQELVSAMKQLPFYPVVPIDWRINQALMALVKEGKAGAGAAWFVEPGPIDQMSMR